MSRVQQMLRPLLTFVITVLTFGITVVLLSVIVQQIAPSPGAFVTFLLALIAGFFTGFVVPLFRKCWRPRFFIPFCFLLLFAIVGAITVGLAYSQETGNASFRLIYCFLMATGSVVGSYFGVTVLHIFKKPTVPTSSTSKTSAEDATLSRH